LLSINTPTLTPNYAAIYDIAATEAIQTIIAEWTPFPISTDGAPLVLDIPQLLPDQLRFSGRNEDWSPFIDEFAGVEMVLVPAGCFMMGDENGEQDEYPVHEVCFEESFWIDRYEVTNVDYGSSGLYSNSNYPREDLTWVDAQKFCEHRGARLPTEAEWEYAARGPSNWIYPWGNEFIAENAVCWSNSVGHPSDIGSRLGGQSWVGAYDMSGNVWEWVNDWYGPYSEERQINPIGPESGEYRIYRGGSWGNNHVGTLRSSYRTATVPDDYRTGGWNYDIGFRCARSF
jgi:formylglycine-generating enzyme required for sulfatase activity